MAELLDYEPPVKRFKPVFSILSFGFGIISVVTLAYMVFPLHRTIKASDSINGQFSGALNLFRIIFVLGIISSVICVVRGEQLKFYKAAGILINLVLLVLVLGAVIFANMMEQMMVD